MRSWSGGEGVPCALHVLDVDDEDENVVPCWPAAEATCVDDCVEEEEDTEVEEGAEDEEDENVEGRRYDECPVAGVACRVMTGVTCVSLRRNDNADHLEEWQ